MLAAVISVSASRSRHINRLSDAVFVNDGTILAGATAIVAAAIIAFFAIDIGALPLLSMGAGAAILVGLVFAGAGGSSKVGIVINVGAALALSGISYLVIGVAFPSLSTVEAPLLPYGLFYVLEIFASYAVFIGTVWFMTSRGSWTGEDAIVYLSPPIAIPTAAVVVGGVALLQSGFPIPETGNYSGGEGVIGAYALFVGNDILMSIGTLIRRRL